MAPEDFPAAGICGGNWWSSSKSVFMGGGSSPCSMGINGDLGAYMSYWMGDMVDLKPRSSCKDYSYNNNIIYSNNIIDQASSGSGDHNSMVFQTSQKPQQADSDSGGSSILMDSTLQMMGFNISSSSSSSSPDWNEAFLHGNTASGRPEAYNSMLQEDMNLGLNASSEIQKDWAGGNTKSFPSSNTTTATGGQDDTSIGPFKSINQDFSLDQQRLDNNPTATCQGLSSSGLPMGPAIYGYPSALIQSLFELDPPHPQQQALFSSRSPMNYCGTDSLSERPSPSCWHKISSPSVLPKQQKANTDLHFSNSAPFWNASESSIDDIRSSFLSSSQPQFILPTLEEKPNFNNLTTKINNNIEEVRNSGSVVKKVCEPIFKRQRIEAPSPLPTFKVRKEKLGDRITALQQLVSPFGKTDTASVLHEAIEYIKFLHDQVNVLSTPYMKNGNPVQRQQQTEDRSKDPEGLKQDLKSRGLCLVPISSTFPVASETTSDFWTPAFGGTFRPTPTKDGRMTTSIPKGKLRNYTYNALC